MREGEAGGRQRGGVVGRGRERSLVDGGSHEEEHATTHALSRKF